MKTKRNYSGHLVMSATYGGHIRVRDRFHDDLLALADARFDVVGYAVDTPTIFYVVNGQKKEWDFPLSVQLRNGGLELWASTREQGTTAGGPLDMARRAHAEDLRATFRLFTEADLRGNPTFHANRMTLRSYMASWYEVDTGALEQELLTATPATAPVTIAELATTTSQPFDAVRLALFRLLKRGALSGDLDITRISLKSQLWRARHVAHT
jgi:hypothetical protein